MCVCKFEEHGRSVAKMSVGGINVQHGRGMILEKFALQRYQVEQI